MNAVEDSEVTDLEAEKVKLERNLQKNMIDLKGILTLNDEIIRQNSDKDLRISHREKVLERVIEQNKEDYSQLELEKACASESLKYEISSLELKLQEIEHYKSRYSALENENNDLKGILKGIFDQFSIDRTSFATEMHGLNKSMQSMRQEMEGMFSRKLVDMDVKFRVHAFDSLNDQKKKNLLTHSKLKDELAMQGNGQSNLLVRVSRIRTNFDQTCKDIKKLSKWASTLRRKIKKIKSSKLQADDLLIRYEKEIADLTESKELLLSELDSWPHIFDLEEATEECHNTISSSTYDLKLWLSRLEKLIAIESELSLFLLTHKKMLESFGDSIICSETSSATNTLKLAEFRRAIETDTTLRQIFNKVRGKESLLLIAEGSTALGCNPLAWSSKHILDIWNFIPDSDQSDFVDKSAVSNDPSDYNNDQFGLKWPDFIQELPSETSGERLTQSSWVRPILNPHLFAEDINYKYSEPKRTANNRKIKLQGDENISLLPSSGNEVFMPPIVRKSATFVTALNSSAIPVKSSTSLLNSKKIETINETKVSPEEQTRISKSYSLPLFKLKVNVNDLLLSSKRQLSKVQSCQLLPMDTTVAKGSVHI